MFILGLVAYDGDSPDEHELDRSNDIDNSRQIRRRLNSNTSSTPKPGPSTLSSSIIQSNQNHQDNQRPGSKSKFNTNNSNPNVRTHLCAYIPAPVSLLSRYWFLFFSLGLGSYSKSERLGIDKRFVIFLSFLYFRHLILLGSLRTCKE